MFKNTRINKLDDFFVELKNRQNRGVYFYRINGYSDEIDSFIKKYYKVARQNGVIIEGGIQNPTENNLSYYNEIMGMNFYMNAGFINSSLKKWLPRMNDYQCKNMSESIYDTLNALRQSGKNDNMLRNAYIKFMCWLYYKFERIVNLLGEDNVPKILYEGKITNHELLLISVLVKSGCDVVLLQYDGDQNYLRFDPKSQLSYNLDITNLKPFPKTFNLKGIFQQIKEEYDNERLYGIKPSICNCTNAWIEGKGLEDLQKDILTRGNDTGFYYNCYCRINGVEDKLTYINELYQFYQKLMNSRRKIVVVNECISIPTNEEIRMINRKNYTKLDQMLLDLSNNIKYSANIELQRIMVKSFLDIMLSESKLPNMNLNKLTNKAVYLICWLNRFKSQLFSNWKAPEISCFIYMGGCKNESEAIFVKFLARLPIDVLILNPNLNNKCCLQDPLLYEINYINSLDINIFPQENADVHIGTVAYHAERELDTLMYENSGIYRNRQYSKANTVTLRTIYEEIKVLWNEDMKYRPNFSINNESVNIPVIFAKISGVKDKNKSQYWSSIKDLITEDTYVIRDIPYIKPTDANPVKAYSAEFFKNKRLLKTKIKQHSCYQYEVLRDEVQDYILDKLQSIIDSKLIKGTFENGTEYTIIATVLNMPKSIVRLIQKYDFTKKNPKLIVINTGEEMISLQDTILTVFLNFIGFDILYFIPTGYQNIEKYLNRKIIEEHQIGEYMYDLQTPDFIDIESSEHTKKWSNKIFKRGRWIWD